MEKNVEHWVVRLFAIFIAVMITGAGCSAIDMKHNRKNGDSKPILFDHDDEVEAPRYYDFHDVLIPGELTEDKKHSSVIQSGGVATGFMAFYGRVEGRSVIKFFNIKMKEDGWKPESVLKSSSSTIMLFYKEKRWCVVNIREKGFTTDVEVGIAPAIGKT